jgi:hypothetical protein
MIFFIEHGIGSEHRFRILINYNEIEVGEFENIKNLFFCETIDEAMDVMKELRELDK